MIHLKAVLTLLMCWILSVVPFVIASVVIYFFTWDLPLTVIVTIPTVLLMALIKFTLPQIYKDLRNKAVKS